MEAGEQGFEPQLSDPESDVLPLDDSPSLRSMFKRKPKYRGTARTLATLDPGIETGQVREPKPDIAHFAQLSWFDNAGSG